MNEIEKVVARALPTALRRSKEIEVAQVLLAALREAGFVVVSDHEDPTPAMLARGVAMHRTPRSGDDETLVHDIWQAMWDEMMAEGNDG